MSESKKTKRSTLGIKPAAAASEPAAKLRAPVRGRHAPRDRSKPVSHTPAAEGNAKRAEAKPAPVRAPRPADLDPASTRRRPRPADVDAPAPSQRRARENVIPDKGPDTRPRRDDRSAAKPVWKRQPEQAKQTETQHFFASCPRGLEAELLAELAALGAGDVRRAPGGAAFSGAAELGWRICLWSRLATRVLRRVSEGRYRDEEDLYQGALKLDWPSLFDVTRTLAVTTLARSSPLKSLNFASLRIKDAVCDRFRAEVGERPSVDTHSPDVPLVLYLGEERFTLYLDLAGEPLNRRGFRVEPSSAPINENLAAGILRLAGWQPDMPLYDPMMGGGTFLVEAAMIALNIAPGLGRHFAFEKFRDFDMVEWQRLRKNAEAAQHERQDLPIYGSDSDPLMVRAAGLNLQAAGLIDCVRLREADFLDVDAPPGPGLVVSNPPYGVRLSVDDMAALYKGMGDVLKQRYAGWTAAFISADPEFPKGIGLSASRRTPLYNGPLECRLFAYRLVSGSNRATK